MYSIGMICKALGLTRNALIYYEKQGIVHPEKGENGYRAYSEEDLIALRRVTLLRNLGLSTEEISDLFHGDRPQMEKALMSCREAIQHKIAFYQALMDSLDQIMVDTDADPILLQMPTYYHQTVLFQKLPTEGCDESLSRHLPFTVYAARVDVNGPEDQVYQGYLAIREDHMDILELDKAQYQMFGGCQAVSFFAVCEWGEELLQTIRAVKDRLESSQMKLEDYAYVLGSVLLPEDAGKGRIQICIPIKKA